jgi:pimeloyl-ACP methyl ester carboxylesterase
MTDRYVDTAAAKFRYVRIGRGSPVLLLPGSGGWRLTFHTLAEVLAERHTVFALDPPGQGLTEVLDPDFCYDADAIARSIAAFLDAVGLERTAIVGHSWGGGFALRFSQLYPDRVTRLALLGPGGLDVKDVWEFRLLRLPVLGELAVRLQSAAAVRRMLRKSFVHRERVPNLLVREVVREMKSLPHRTARLTDMLRVERSVSWAQTEADLHLVRAPVLLLWGNRLFGSMRGRAVVGRGGNRTRRAGCVVGSGRRF